MNSTQTALSVHATALPLTWTGISGNRTQARTGMDWGASAGQTVPKCDRTGAVVEGTTSRSLVKCLLRTGGTARVAILRPAGLRYSEYIDMFGIEGV